MLIQSCIKADTYLQLVFILIRTIHVAAFGNYDKVSAAWFAGASVVDFAKWCNVAGEVFSNKHDKSHFHWLKDF